MQEIQILHEWVRRSRLKKSWPGKYFSALEHRPPLRFVLNLVLSGQNPVYRASNSKDRALGLVGLLRSLDVDLITPDYQKTLNEIILEIFTAVSTKYQTLEFLHFVNGDESTGDLPSWVPGFSTTPWCPSDDNMRHSTEVHTGTFGLDFALEGRKLWFYGTLLDTINTVTPTTTSERLPSENRSQPFAENPCQGFYAHIQTLIRFIRTSKAGQRLNRSEANSLLFKLLLHSQIMPFYNDSGLLRPPSYISLRLLEHFRQWTIAVESRDRTLKMENEQRFNQGMHFVSTEMVNITAGSGAGDMEHCFGYPRAIRTVHGWVKDNVSRKRVFTTEKGWVEIG